MSILSGHIACPIPSHTDISVLRDRGIEYSASVHRKPRLLDRMKLALRSRHYSRLMGCLRLRVQDIDFGRNEILVRDGKGVRSPADML